jgi:hypothetical protein
MTQIERIENAIRNFNKSKEHEMEIRKQIRRHVPHGPERFRLRDMLNYKIFEDELKS